MIPTFEAGGVDFSRGAEVRSGTLRFVLPVPALDGGGDLLFQPEGENAGRPFVEASGQRIEGRGLAFFNVDDGCNDFVRGDGGGVIVIGGVDEHQGERLRARIAALEDDPGNSPIEVLKGVLRHARRDLGLIAFSGSTAAYVREAMSPAGEAALGGPGLYRRRADQICRAVYLPGRGRFLGPAASPQAFEDGGVVVRHLGEARLVQPAMFLRDYEHLDGRPLRLADLPVQSILAPSLSRP